MARLCAQGETVQYLRDLEKQNRQTLCWTQNSEHKNSPAKNTLRKSETQSMPLTVHYSKPPLSPSIFNWNTNAPVHTHPMVSGFTLCSIISFQIVLTVNEDTLLPMMFLGLRKLGNICCGHKMFLNKISNIFCPGHKICVRNKCCTRGQTGKHLCRQQCVRNNVSSFARALSLETRALFWISELWRSVTQSYDRVCQNTNTYLVIF